MTGRVHGVWFRDSTRRQAVEHGVAGWVRNRPDGTVEAVFEGDPCAVAQCVSWCRDGPPRAQVLGVEVVDEPPDGLIDFVIR